MINGKDLAGDILSRLKYYKQLGDQTFEQLEDDDFFWQPNRDTNSIALIIQHLYGNMMSRFTQFLTEDGEKPWRRRDAEFEPMDLSRQDLLDFWNTGWHTVFQSVEALSADDMEREVTIRSEKLRVWDALLRQLAHYPYHVGQIVFIGKCLKGSDFRSLSIPRGSSEAYWQQKQEGHAGETADGKA